MNRVREGFDFAIACAKSAANSGEMNGMARHLSAAHALALWAEPMLLPEFDKINAECWKEYETWKTTNRKSA